MSDRILVCGAGGYVGRNLVRFLAARGNQVVAVTRTPPKSLPPGVEFDLADLSNAEECRNLIQKLSPRWVFNLAAQVGGIQFVNANQSTGLNDVLINSNLIDACARVGIARYFFASSSCVYPDIATPLKESDAYPANPVGGYGWAKLFSERVCAAYSAERNLPTTVLRYHGIYGPGDIRPQGRDHVISSLVKKVAQAKLSRTSEIPVWGDGTQTRSFLYIDDCIEGTVRAMDRGVDGPFNLAHPTPVSIKDIISTLEYIAAFPLVPFYNRDAPVGRVHKTADCTAMRDALNWQPETSLKDGLSRTYHEAWTEVAYAK